MYILFANLLLLYVKTFFFSKYYNNITPIDNHPYNEYHCDIVILKKIFFETG